MNTDSILDSRLWPRIGLGHAPTENAQFRDDIANQAHLANQLLLYDRIVIPTNDFAIVPVLIHWLGLKTFIDAIEKRIFSFVRCKGVLGYVGNGLGINLLEISSGPDKSFLWWQESMFGDFEKSLMLQLENCDEITPPHECQRIFDLVVNVSHEFIQNNDFFLKNIVDESYTDILNNPEFSNFVLRERSHRSVDTILSQFSGIDPNQVRFSSLGPIKDAIDLVLRVSEVNLDITIATSVGNCDLFSCEGSDMLLKRKLERAGFSNSQATRFFKLAGIKSYSGHRVWDSRGKDLFKGSLGFARKTCFKKISTMDA